jgi:hypothetical protein
MGFSSVGLCLSDLIIFLFTKLTVPDKCLGVAVPVDGPVGVLLPLHPAEERLPLRAQGGPAAFHTSLIDLQYNKLILYSRADRIWGTDEDTYFGIDQKT